MLPINRRTFLNRLGVASTSVCGVGALPVLMRSSWADESSTKSPGPTSAVNADPTASWDLLYTTQGKSARICVDGGDQSYFDFQIPNQATWQPGPIFSHGRWIAFCRAATGEAPALWVMKADGGEPRRLTSGWHDRGADHPRWFAGKKSAG